MFLLLAFFVDSPFHIWWFYGPTILSNGYACLFALTFVKRDFVQKESVSLAIYTRKYIAIFMHFLIKACYVCTILYDGMQITILDLPFLPPTDIRYLQFSLEKMNFQDCNVALFSHLFVTTNFYKLADGAPVLRSSLPPTIPRKLDCFLVTSLFTCILTVRSDIIIIEQQFDYECLLRVHS